jgi:hypothetical protein
MIIYRGIINVVDAPIDDNSILKHTLMGEHVINMTFSLETFVDVRIGDFINWRGRKYKAIKQPVIKKSKSNSFLYNVDFYAPQYNYDQALFLLDGINDFYLSGTVETFVFLIRDNMNRAGGTGVYGVGTYPTTSFKNIQFNQDTCLSSLQKICVEFGLEYKFADNGLSFNVAESVGVATALSFQFKNGLRDIERKELNDGQFMTRLYPYGSERNIIYGDYGSRRLQLTSGTKYIENNISTFGVIEKSVIFEDIYPRRLANVQDIDLLDPTKFKDYSIDFDLNDQLSSSIAKVTFNSGLLAGYEFEVEKYNHTTKEFTLIAITTDQDETLPNAISKPQVGDQYVIHDIVMPESYITAAETELLSRANEYLAKYSVPNVIYEIKPDHVWFRSNVVTLNVGDIIQIVDTDFGITISTKVVEIQQSLADQYKYVIKVGNNSFVTLLNRVQIGIEVNNENIVKERIDRTAERIRIAQKVKDLNTVTKDIFDVDGYFNNEKIKPLSIETAALSVGAKPLNMNIVGLELDPNRYGIKNKIYNTSCTLVHFTIEPIVKEFAIPSNTVDLINDHAYYIYAVCNPTTNQGIIEYSLEQKKIDHSAGLYTFLLGFLHAGILTNGAIRRNISLTYGQTFINGKFITTGKIQSLNGYNYLDLDNGSLLLSDGGFNGMDWNVTNPNTLTIKGALFQNKFGGEGSLPLWRGDYNNTTIYAKDDAVYYSGSTYIAIGTLFSGAPPTDITKWKIMAAKGLDGEGTTTYTWIKYADTAGGSGLSNDPTGKTYIGLAYNKPTTTESTNPADYSWSLIKGVDGVDGLQGYTWIKYSNNADGTGLYDIPNAFTEYIGIAVNKFDASESTNKADYVWSKFRGDDGVPGTDGSDGPGLVYRGVFYNGMTLYNNSVRRDVVKSGSTYYIYNFTDALVQSSFVVGRFQNFGAQFESVATNLLLAESANIADFIINGGKISSQTVVGSDPRLQFNGNTGVITLKSNKTIYNELDTASVVVQTIKIDSSTGQIISTHSGNASQESATSILDTDGLNLNFAGNSINGSTAGEGAFTKKMGIKADVRAKLRVYGGGSNTSVIGVYGKATNNYATVNERAPTFGGWFERIMCRGLYTSVRAITSGVTLNSTDCYVYASGINYTTYLPSEINNLDGRMILFQAKGTKTIAGSDGNTIEFSHSAGSYGSVSITDTLCMLVKVGGIWRATRIGQQ